MDIYICDIFYEGRDLNTASYVDDNTPNSYCKELNYIFKILENEAKK